MSEYKRLTRRDGESIWVRRTKYTLDESTNLGAIINRLAQYENIGSPEEFAELMKAKAEGRILPEKRSGNAYLTKDAIEVLKQIGGATNG